MNSKMGLGLVAGALCVVGGAVYMLNGAGNTPAKVTPQQAVEASHKQVLQLPASATPDNPDLLLVNKQHLLEKELGFKQAQRQGVSFDARIEAPLTEFLTAAADAGHPNTMVSGYRSKAYQKQVFDQKVNEYLGQGMSRAEAEKQTRAFIQTPGASEHQSGLAVDVMANDFWNTHHTLEQDADKTKGQQWLIQHAPDYGFVLRFPKGEKAEASTGISYESWHFRYVGKENAQFMTKHGMTLEDYHVAMDRA